MNFAVTDELPIIYSYLLTCLLTPWCRVLLEKLTGLQLVKKSPAFLRNPKVHYRTHKRLPPVPVLGQPNPVHSNCTTSFYGLNSSPPKKNFQTDTRNYVLTFYSYVNKYTAYNSRL